ncbi:autophagy-related protein 16-1-like [Ctenocephalides felis]|uniref:autophagy-related protein 16-1-like n=1 Tax=Ctenocephalides felis TaxID=7515 RepID=UPI000E6E3E77|nr:autophagy-related protein 16-1-like [Ctenocephalides felis]
MSADQTNWRENILKDLRERDGRETKDFQELILLHNRLFDNVTTLRTENLQLTIENEKLRSGSGIPGSHSNDTSSRISVLEQKCMSQQEELTELHRRKGENAQQIIDLNAQLQELTKKLTSKEQSLTEIGIKNTSLQAEVQMLVNGKKELEVLNTMLRDEHTALQLAFASLEEKLRKSQDENRILLERKRNDRMCRELEDAAKENRAGISPDRANSRDLVNATYCGALPSKVSCKFDAHDSEVSAVRWNPVERIVATGGADRKVKLWSITKGSFESRGTLVGSNAGVMSVDFDSTGTLILGASNDFASRVWTVSDQRLREQGQAFLLIRT